MLTARRLFVIALLLGTGLTGIARAGGAGPLALGGLAPEIAGGPWINSAPLTLAELRGRVVLVEFWTYG
jgi:hypothetical protein